MDRRDPPRDDHSSAQGLPGHHRGEGGPPPRSHGPGGTGLSRDELQTRIDAVALPNPNDRRVLAAAIRARAQIIVTNNSRDFPADYLATWDVEAKTADEFVLDQISLNRQAVYGEIVRIADSHSNPPESVADVLDRLERCGLVESVAALAS